MRIAQKPHNHSRQHMVHTLRGGWNDFFTADMEAVFGALLFSAGRPAPIHVGNGFLTKNNVLHNEYGLVFDNFNEWKRQVRDTLHTFMHIHPDESALMFSVMEAAEDLYLEWIRNFLDGGKNG
jgi:hypothetical protein